MMKVCHGQDVERRVYDELGWNNGMNNGRVHGRVLNPFTPRFLAEGTGEKSLSRLLLPVFLN